MDLSVIIPARNEGFLKNTIDDVLKNMKGDTEVIVVCDGYWPEPPIPDNPKVTILHYTNAQGQRASVNNAAKISRAEYIMKLDGHCAVENGFDLKLLAPYRDGRLGKDVTTIPRLYNLHAFDWKCSGCGYRQYQGKQPEKCDRCQGTIHEMVTVWAPRWSRKSDFGRIDKNLRFQYWWRCGQRLSSQADIADLMCHVGACWVMNRERYWELGGLDEEHGSWGQMGVEIALKSWLSGGRQVVNKTTWYSHMFRTGKGFSWPYKITNHEVEKAREYSRDFWLNNKWPLQKREFKWLIEHFRPVPDWHDVEYEKEGLEIQMAKVKAEKSPRRRARMMKELQETGTVTRTLTGECTAKKVLRIAKNAGKADIEEFKEEPAEFLFMTLTPRAAELYRKLMKELAKQGDD